MATIRRFEELEVWKDARDICRRVHVLTREPGLSKDFSLRDQINRSSGSVMDNIAEGFERDGRKEFLNFLHIAKGSLGETRSQLHRALDKGYINELTHKEMETDCLRLSIKLSHFITYLRNTTHEGLKNRPL